MREAATAGSSGLIACQCSQCPVPRVEREMSGAGETLVPKASRLRRRQLKCMGEAFGVYAALFLGAGVLPDLAGLGRTAG